MLGETSNLSWLDTGIFLMSRRTSEPRSLSTLFRRNSNTLQLGGGRVFLSGGYDELNHHLEPAIYDANKNEWKRIRPPQSGGKDDAALLGTRGIVMAGSSLSHYEKYSQHEKEAARLEMVEVYSFEDDEWVSAEPCFDWPPFASSIVVNVGPDTVLFYGAHYDESTEDPNRIATYNVRLGEWQVSPTAPFCTRYRGMTDVLVLSEDEVIFNQTHLYRLSENSWVDLPNSLFTLKRPRYFRVGNLLYCFGMSDSLDGGIQVFDIERRKIQFETTVNGVIGQNIYSLYDGSMLVFGGRHTETVIGNRDGRKGWLERVLHVGVGAESVNFVSSLSEEHSLGKVVPVGGNQAVVLSSDCTQSWLLSYGDWGLAISERERAVISAVGHFAWLDEWLAICESPAEEQFLIAAVAEFRLGPAGGMLVGDCALEMQVEIGRARVDFLFDGIYVVEIDGREFHSDRDEATRDAARDAKIREQGFRILRIPAYRVFHAIAAAMGDVRDAIL